MVDQTPILSLSSLNPVCSDVSLDIKDALQSVVPASASINYYTDASASIIASSTLVSTVGSTTYYVQAEQGNCKSTVQPILATVNPIPAAPSPSYDKLCAEQVLRLFVQSPDASMQYDWSTTNTNGFSGSGESVEVSNSATLADEGLYRVTATKNNCTSLPATVTVNLENTPAPILNLNGEVLINGQELVLCKENLPQVFSVSNVGALSSTWTLDGEDSDAIIMEEEQGVLLVATDNGSCVGTASVKVELNALELEADADQYAIPIGESIELSVTSIGNAQAVYSWTTQSGNAIGEGAVINYSPEVPGFYKVSGVNIYGCKATASTSVVNVYVPISIPAAFTPNGDSYNDVWNINGIETYPRASVKIYNRWGNEVYRIFGGYDNDWDGTRKGSKLPDGVYFYVIDLGEADQDPLRGTVTIQR